MIYDKYITEKSISSSINYERAKMVPTNSKFIFKKINKIFEWFNELDKKSEDST
jgi:hypothetical protein